MSKTTAYFNINYFLKEKTSHNLKIYTAVNFHFTSEQTEASVVQK